MLCYSAILNIHYFKLLFPSFKTAVSVKGVGFPTFISFFFLRKLFLKTSDSNFLLPGYTFCHFPERDANLHIHKTYATRGVAKTLRSFPRIHLDVWRSVLTAV